MSRALRLGWDPSHGAAASGRQTLTLRNQNDIEPHGAKLRAADGFGECFRPVVRSDPITSITGSSANHVT